MELLGKVSGILLGSALAFIPCMFLYKVFIDH